jgi:4-hydroxythreonine-4-phosphate dehydrogenase
VIPKIAISPGDPNGIGPEIIIGMLNRIRVDEVAIILLGNSRVTEFTSVGSGSGSIGVNTRIKHLDSEEMVTSPGVYLLPAGDADFTPSPGQLSAEAGKFSMQCVARGIHLCLSGHANALVTAPISKEAIHLGGYDYPGHTEFLAVRTGTDHVLMMMVSERMRVALATAHIPLNAVAGSLNSDLILKQLDTLNKSLSHDFGIPDPKISVLGLNPHAGDGGILGREETGIIIPAMQQATAAGLNVQGPYPADSFFARMLYKDFDAVLAMYHDQGLIPFKSTDNGRGVNFTAGLPIIRTSPDHGTAFDIAGKGAADPASMVAAYELALKLVLNTLSQKAHS